MGKKMCEICGKNPATVPDRNRPGRLVNRLCGECHAKRLRGDMRFVLGVQGRKARGEE